MNTFAPLRDPEVPVLLTVHSCVFTWWQAVHGVRPPDAWDRYGELVASALHRADALAVPSAALRDQLSALHGELPPARVIPNGRSVPLTAPQAPREELVITVGRLWDEAKNAALLARAAPGIHGTVMLIGPGELDGVRGTGPLPGAEVLGWMRRACIFVEPARYEPFGLAALEAALSGCALVLGDIPSLREVWGDAAVYVSGEDPDELAATVNALLTDRRRREHAAQAAQDRARRYTPASMVIAYRRAYRDVARLRAPA
jgi:glycogen(starch) synthase